MKMKKQLERLTKGMVAVVFLMAMWPVLYVVNKVFEVPPNTE
jgi:hypothetical protein